MRSASALALMCSWETFTIGPGGLYLNTNGKPDALGMYRMAVHRGAERWPGVPRLPKIRDMMMLVIGPDDAAAQAAGVAGTEEHGVVEEFLGSRRDAELTRMAEAYLPPLPDDPEHALDILTQRQQLLGIDIASRFTELLRAAPTLVVGINAAGGPARPGDAVASVRIPAGARRRGRAGLVGSSQTRVVQDSRAGVPGVGSAVRAPSRPPLVAGALRRPPLVRPPAGTTVVSFDNGFRVYLVGDGLVGRPWVDSLKAVVREGIGASAIAVASSYRVDRSTRKRVPHLGVARQVAAIMAAHALERDRFPGADGVDTVGHDAPLLLVGYEDLADLTVEQARKFGVPQLTRPHQATGGLTLDVTWVLRGAVGGRRGFDVGARLTALRLLEAMKSLSDGDVDGSADAMSAREMAEWVAQYTTATVESFFRQYRAELHAQAPQLGAANAVMSHGWASVLESLPVITQADLDGLADTTRMKRHLAVLEVDRRYPEATDAAIALISAPDTQTEQDILINKLTPLVPDLDLIGMLAGDDGALHTLVTGVWTVIRGEGSMAQRTTWWEAQIMHNKRWFVDRKDYATKAAGVLEQLQKAYVGDDAADIRNALERGKRAVYTCIT